MSGDHPHPVITGLYVPGDRPERFDKAVGTGAHLVIIDLEDAVAPDRKDLARDAVCEWLAQRPLPLDSVSSAASTIIQVRIRAGDERDLRALAALDATFDIRVPKVESPADIDAVVEAVPGHPITALVETARGVENAGSVAAHSAVTRMALGESDLASDVGSSAASVMDYARTRVLFASRAAGLVAPMLSAYPNIRDVDGLRADTVRGRELGWVGRNAIHPTQLAVIADVFRPPAARVSWALEVLSAVGAGGVTTLSNGDMVDDAMVGRARTILSLADALNEEARHEDARREET